MTTISSKFSVSGLNIYIQDEAMPMVDRLPWHTFSDDGEMYYDNNSSNTSLNLL